MLNTLRMNLRARSSIGRRLQSTFVSKCPEPQYDTGCTYCEADLSADKQIDYDRPLRNTKSYPWKHVIVLNEPSVRDVDYNEWPSRLETSGRFGYIIGDMNGHKRDIVDPFHPVLISMTNLNWDQGSSSNNTSSDVTFGLYPDGKSIKVPRDQIEEFMIGYLRPFPEEGAENSEAIKELQLGFQSQFESQDIKEDLILVCGHTKRDERCGKLAPLILNEFDKVIEHRGLKDVKTGVISHIGGHVYAGNVLIFKSKLKKVIWYGRVLPRHVQGIVDESVVQDNIIEELYRG